LVKTILVAATTKLNLMAFFTFYHYTSITNLVQIVKDNRLNASNMKSNSDDATFGEGTYFTIKDPLKNSWYDIQINNWTLRRIDKNACLELKVPQKIKNKIKKQDAGGRDIHLLPEQDFEDLSNYLTAVYCLEEETLPQLVNIIKKCKTSFLPKKVCICKLSKTTGCWEVLRYEIVEFDSANGNNWLKLGGITAFAIVALVGIFSKNLVKT